MSNELGHFPGSYPGLLGPWVCETLAVSSHMFHRDWLGAIEEGGGKVVGARRREESGGEEVRRGRRRRRQSVGYPGKGQEALGGGARRGYPSKQHIGRVGRGSVGLVLERHGDELRQIGFAASDQGAVSSSGRLSVAGVSRSRREGRFPGETIGESVLVRSQHGVHTSICHGRSGRCAAEEYCRKWEWEFRSWRWETR